MYPYFYLFYLCFRYRILSVYVISRVFLVSFRYSIQWDNNGDEETFWSKSYGKGS